MVNIQKVDNVIKFTFTDSDFYLYGTGSISVPLNSLSLYIDESDMITYKKANSNDIFVSVPIDETNFSSKSDVIDFYKENMVGSTGGGSEDAFTDVSYDSSAHTINFYNENGDEVATLDATAFIKDGMVDSVAIDNGYLVITFNVDAGKETIRIPLTDIFPADYYYTKSDVDLLLTDYQPVSGLSAVTLSTFVNDANFVTESEVDEKTTICEYDGWYETSGAFLQGQWYAIEVTSTNPVYGTFYFRIALGGVFFSLGVKAVNNVIAFTDGGGTVIDRPSFISSDSYYDSAEKKFYVYLNDNYIDNVPNTQGYALRLATTKNCESIKDYAEGLSESISSYSGDISTISGDVSTISTALATLSGKVDTNEEVVSRSLNLLNSTKQDTLVAGENITISGNTISATVGEIPTKLSELENDCGFVTSSVTDSLSGIIEQNELIVASSLVDLDNRKIDASAVTDYSTEISAINASLSALNASISALSASVDTKEEVISIALNSLNTRLGGLTLLKITQTDYENLAVKDENTLYVVIPDQNP